MQQRSLAAAALAALLCAGSTWPSQDPEEAPAPSAEALARMQPGPLHAELQPLIGSWRLSGKYRFGPDAAWAPFEAEVERRWILDGRFVEERVTSQLMGQPFEGLGLIGYDNTRGAFTMVWVENLSTGTWFSHGRLEGKKLVFEGTNSDALTGDVERWGRSVIDLGREDQLCLGFNKDAGGREFLSMESTLARRE